MSKGIYGFRDRSKEISTMELNFIDVAAGGANFDTVVGFVDAIGAVFNTASLCTQSTENFKQETDTPDPAIPSDVHAQREAGCRIFYGDDVTGKVYHVTLPGPDKDNMAMIAQSDNYDLTDTVLAAVIAAMESGALSPDGNAITVLRAVDVGRNN
jgi:hypothetical protein